MLFFAPAAFGQASEGLFHPVPSGATAAAAAAEAAEEAKDPESVSAAKRKDRFTYGKRKGKEAVVSKDSTNAIQKTKDGSADVTVPTGVFKDSLLDADLPAKSVPARTPTFRERVNLADRANTSAQPAASASPFAPG